MPRKSHSEEQIVYAIRQVEAGKKVTDVCREMGVSAQASTTGSSAMPVTVSANCASCGNHATRTVN